MPAILSRRGALRSLFFAAPAIVAAPSLMRVSAKFFAAEPLIVTPDFANLSDLISATLRNRSAELARAVTSNNALLRHLQSLNAIQRYDAMIQLSGTTNLMRGHA